jgi:hypothetical protein
MDGILGTHKGANPGYALEVAVRTIVACRARR